MKQKYPELYHHNSIDWLLVIVYSSGEQEFYSLLSGWVSDGHDWYLFNGSFTCIGEIK